MDNQMYWITSLVFASVLLCIYFSDFTKNATHNKVERSYRMMIGWVIFFCVQDAFWGMCSAGIVRNDVVFFISSSVFHIATVLTTFFWLYYILTYLGTRVRYGRIYLMLDAAVIAGELFFVVSNIFSPVLFSIQDGQYITGTYRPLTFINQYVVYILIGIVTLICTLREKGKGKEQYFCAFMFSIAPILLGSFQLKFPQAPFYSIGYFLGCFIVHLFIIAKDKEVLNTSRILTPLTDIYYSVHLFDLENDVCERIIDPPIIHALLEGKSGLQNMVDIVMRNTVCDEYLQHSLDFVNLETLPERMKGKSHISMEFIGRNYGWTRFSFILVEGDDDSLRKVMITTQIIDEEKRNQIELLFQSSHDELTGLYNRRAYENELSRKEKEGLEDDLVYVSMDLNGLKNVNDNMGHAAGDEMIVGAAECMKQAFSQYGKIYRIGGDEFAALLNESGYCLLKSKALFEKLLSQWRGSLVEKLTVSCGYVCSAELEKPSVHKMATLADRRMYQEKSDFYRQKGVDRRGQRDAHAVLCSLYTKMLKVNLTTDSYEIISMDEKEQSLEKGYADTISGWLEGFGKTGNVHPDDLEEFLAKTDIGFLRTHFLSGNKLHRVCYRRRTDSGYRQVAMDLVPANDYSPDNQTLFLYVKDIDR